MRFVPALLTLALAAQGCNLLEMEPAAEAPTAPTSVALSVPVILPSPAPTPTPQLAAPPAPQPTPTPTPAPAGENPPAASSCQLPPSNPSRPACGRESPFHYDQVDAALKAVTQRHPELFDFGNSRCENCYYIKNERRYIEEVGKELARRGFCSVWDGEEIGVKSANDWSEQYDILLASGHMWRGPASYQLGCRPAIF